tara:strand:- start:50 stop:244 length:195 start_codon:yes stop_codon:yes gene_type:complete
MTARIINDEGVLKYNVGTSEGEVELHREFITMHSVIQIDIIQDWIHDLEELLEEIKEERENADA